MTRIRIRTLSSGINEYLPKAAIVTFTPWAGYGKHLVVDDEKIIFPDPFDVKIDGKAVQEIILRPTNQFWCWKIEVKGDKKPDFAKYYVVPDADVLDFEDLVEVDPKTFAAVTLPPTTQQLIHDSNEVLQSVLERTVTATVDPDDTNVLLLTFPVYMQSKTQPNLLVLPVGE